MCVVSAVMDYGRDMWPDLIKKDSWISPGVPLIPVPNAPKAPEIDLDEFARILKPGSSARKAERLPTIAEIEAFLKLVQAAEEFDKKADQPHCEDPEKIKLLKQLEDRLRMLRMAGSSIYGSSNLPAMIQIGGRQVQLGTVVRRAFTDSGLTVEAWNDLEETVREHKLVDAIAVMRREAAGPK